VAEVARGVEMTKVAASCVVLLEGSSESIIGYLEINTCYPCLYIIVGSLEEEVEDALLKSETNRDS
jgi:hypothetical protein